MLIDLGLLFVPGSKDKSDTKSITSIDPDFADDSQDWWTKYFASTLDSEESTRRSRYTGSFAFLLSLCLTT